MTVDCLSKQAAVLWKFILVLKVVGQSTVVCDMKALLSLISCSCLISSLSSFFFPSVPLLLSCLLLLPFLITFHLTFHPPLNTWPLPLSCSVGAAVIWQVIISCCNSISTKNIHSHKKEQYPDIKQKRDTYKGSLDSTEALPAWNGNLYLYL